MPYTTVHAIWGRLYAGLPDLGCGITWEDVHKVRPRPPLSCPDCEGAMSAVLRSGTRFFAHHGKRPEDCPLENESFEHHMTKLVLLGAIRDAGWHAELEVSAPDKSWRADVMATSMDGSRRMAWEAQLSPITIDHIKERTDRYAEAGIQVCWVSPHAQTPKWIDEVPAVKAIAPEAGGDWSVDDGVAAFDWSFGAWGVRVTPLPAFVRWALDGQVKPVVSLRRYHRVKRRVDGRVRVLRRGMWWTSANSARLQAEHEAMRQGQEKRKRVAEEARRAAEVEAERVRLEGAAREEARRLEELEEINRRTRKVMAERHALWLKERAEQVARRKEAEERRLRQEAEEAERASRAEAEGAAWWGLLSEAQVREFFEAVSAHAQREHHVRLRVPDELRTDHRYGHGVPLYATSGYVYGVARPCPGLAVPPHTFGQLMVFVRNRAEAKVLSDVKCRELVVFDLPEHEQLLFG
ncbi:competence protein CoiA family protein [Streptomyces sp. A0592]|uniref:competence protein CoiA family protein n=1 Tax=Streptomyces sp. A0592 TaxID=2563099 RepID=UPI0014480167|nr:competence protein CoiA family protein [Streptomyces sp. A0592]